MKKILALGISASLLSGCILDNDSDANSVPLESAAIITLSEDFGSSDLVAVNTNYDTMESLHPQAYSDVAFSKGEDSVYFINRYGQNNVIKFDQASLGDVKWQYSVNNPDIENQESNPSQVIEQSTENAYILRYGASEIWQVDPNATSDVDFKVSEINLAQFDADGIPDMIAAVIHQDILYVALQRLTISHSDQDSYLIGINTINNQLIDLSPNDDSTLALTLKVRNPKELSLSEGNLYVAGVGRNVQKIWATGEIILEAQYTGGIEKINLATLITEVILDDGDQITHPYGQIYSVDVYGDNVVFTGYGAWKSLNTYIQSGDSTPVSLDADIEGMDIRFAKFDSIGQLWVGIGDTVNPRTLVYSKDNSSQYEIVQTVYTTLLPNSIIFN